jgi:transposase
VSIYACGSPVDMRKGFDGLSSLVERELGRDVSKRTGAATAGRRSAIEFSAAARNRQHTRCLPAIGVIVMADGYGVC